MSRARRSVRGALTGSWGNVGPGLASLGPMRAALALTCLAALPAAAQERIPSHCIALAQGAERVRAASSGAPVPRAR